jgi:hypothetical protein
VLVSEGAAGGLGDADFIRASVVAVGMKPSVLSGSTVVIEKLYVKWRCDSQGEALTDSVFDIANARRPL